MEIQLWCEGDGSELRRRMNSSAVIAGWEAWATLVADRAELHRRLQTVVAGVRRQTEEAEFRNREAKLEALAEFAAGAGHELNNPLAVVVGRAQLLLGRGLDSEVNRSLRVILGQAQRAHRILRDLMFVARPPAPRLRSCRPSEVLRSCLATFREEFEAKGLSLVVDLDAADSPSWTDPDALGHLAEILLRNAIQATSSGGKIVVRSARVGNELKWWFCDSGNGINATDGAHLFDPFYCGRQAGRGLGLGLPRASRIAALAGGSLHWSSSPGEGAVFQVQLPLISPPEEPADEGPAGRESPAAAQSTPKL